MKCDECVHKGNNISICLWCKWAVRKDYFKPKQKEEVTFVKRKNGVEVFWGNESKGIWKAGD